MKILNLGCGTKTSDHTSVINIDWSLYLVISRNSFLRFVAQFLLRGERRTKLINMPNNVQVHDLRKGLPFPDQSVDAVYHSHMLEHLDRNAVIGFLQEVRRVLKPGGIHRIVVPYFELACRKYLQNVEDCRKDDQFHQEHDVYIAEMIEQSVRREAHGTSQQPPLRRMLENLFLGDARKRGETHQWAYDEVNLSALLHESGYSKIARHTFNSSNIMDWASTGLDLSTEGREYRPGSLYIEAIA